MKVVKTSFPGNKRVDAHFSNFTVQTDQRKRHGGDQSAPNPFDFFFVALATCAGSSALGFCQSHDIPPTGLDVTLKAIPHETEPRYAEVIIELTPPDAIDEAMIPELIKETEDCTVKRHVIQAPSFKMKLKHNN